MINKSFLLKFIKSQSNPSATPLAIFYSPLMNIETTYQYFWSIKIVYIKIIFNTLAYSILLLTLMKF